MKNRAAASILVAMLGTASGAMAQSFTGTLQNPTIDRWWYPFNFSGGTEDSASIFAALGQVGFDDRDAQFVVAFDTGSVVAPNLGPGKYQVGSVRLRVTISNPPRFLYDPTFDSVRTSYDVTDPLYQADDAGKPIEVFAVGFRNGVTAASLVESTPFSTTPSFPPQESIRSVFPSLLSADGLATGDISNQVTQRFEAPPMAVGRNPALVAGELVPTTTEFAFDIDLTQPANAAYIARGLDAGRILLVVSSLHPATGGPGGGTGDPAYPAFYTKEHPLASALNVQPHLDLDVTLTPIIDFNNDGLFPDTADIDDLLSVFSGGPCIGSNWCSSIDVNGDGLFPDTADIDYFLCIFSGGGGNC